MDFLDNVDWGGMVNQAATGAINQHYAQAQPNAMTSINPATGRPYSDGMPITTTGSMLKSPVVLIGGVLVLGLAAYFMLRK